MMARAINQKMMLVSILALLLGKDVEALDIYLARMVYQNESGAKDEETKRLQEDLFQKLASAELNESVSLHKVDGGESPPESYLDAARLSESQGYANLLYGYIKRTSYSYYAEVKLLTRENKDITATFIGGDDDMHYQRLVDDLAAKIVTYIRDDLGMAPLQSRKVPVRNILTIPVYVGYWAPMSSGWSNALSGLVCANVGIRYVPTVPLYHLWNRPGFLAMGLDVEYGLGMNQGGLEPFFLHAVRVRLPIEAYLDFKNNDRLGLGLGPMIEIDTMIQSRLYGSTVTETTVTPGVSFSVLYQHALSSSISLGLASIIDIAFYSQPFVVFSPRLSVDFKLLGGSEEKVK